jgi:hypothetical protein
MVDLCERKCHEGKQGGRANCPFTVTVLSMMLASSGVCHATE